MPYVLLGLCKTEWDGSRVENKYAFYLTMPRGGTMLTEYQRDGRILFKWVLRKIGVKRGLTSGYLRFWQRWTRRLCRQRVNFLWILSLSVLPSTSCIWMEYIFLIWILWLSWVMRTTTVITQRVGLWARIHAGNTSNSCYECKMVVRLWRHCTRIVLSQAADYGSWTRCIAQIGEVTSVLNSVACRRDSRILYRLELRGFSVIAPSASAWIHFIQIARIRMEVVALLFVSPSDTGLRRCAMRVTRFMCMCFCRFIYVFLPSVQLCIDIKTLPVT